MMLSYEGLKGNRSQFLNLTGMEVEVFEVLHQVCQFQWYKYIKEFTVEGKKRNRAHRERKDGVLEKTEDQLLFVLHYLKSNSIQEHHAASYGMRQSQCNRWLHLLLHLSLKAAGQLPERDSMKLKKALRGLKEVFIDGTERSIDRPLDSAAQQDCYIGKKRA